MNKKTEKTATQPEEIADSDLDQASGGLLDYDWIAKSKSNIGKDASDGDEAAKGFTAPGDVAGIKR